MTPSREIALFLLSLSVVVGSSPVPTLQDYTHNVVLDGNEDYHMYWKFDDEKITFEVHVRTTGWVGFGFSPNGGMPGSDMVVGWVLDNGEVKFTDRHATAYSEPIIDDKHDYKLLLGKEEDDFTVLKFERLIDTCDDEHDWLLTSDTTRVIWAYHHDDPDDGVPMLRHSHRGTKSVRLLSVVGENESDLGPDVMTYDLLNNNVSDICSVVWVMDHIVIGGRNHFHLPATDTTYYCLGYKLPELDSKHHIIKYEPVIQTGNEAYVHHILVYQCRSDFNETQYHQTGHICYTANMPDDWYYCSSTVIAWAIGGEAFYFPEQAGLSLGADGDPTFVMLEMHYDNPDSLDNIYDSSGIRIYYTPRLREYDASVLNIGQDTSSRQIIPPGAEDYRNYGYCLGGITQQGFVDRVTGEATDVKVFAVALHTHLLGKAVGVTHVRDGKELGVLAKDDHYDFNFQEFSMLAEEVVLKPVCH
ncbi:DBH-like monooxygenase protein 1 homolog [Ptychodera flava]|uniref:DBH-like monooxygenase protein 1 homolog n=1 Tax=Ptychodera flava TaxID=63121 RepID=UPI00396A4B3A